jgi:hypothetical protein
MSTHDAVVGDEAKNDCGAVGAQGTTDVDAVGAEASNIEKVSILYFLKSNICTACTLLYFLLTCFC